MRLTQDRGIQTRSLRGLPLAKAIESINQGARQLPLPTSSDHVAHNTNKQAAKWTNKRPADEWHSFTRMGT